MHWSYRIARIRGTDVKIHVTFFLLIAFYAYEGYASGGPVAAAEITLLVLTLFACVLLHEFGHITMARRFGVRTPDVILLPIGGVARLERIPEDPKQELLIALAGPVVNVVIAGLIQGGLILFRVPAHSVTLNLDGLGFWESIRNLNLWLVVFNMIPAFPMDGGRVLRALLARNMGLMRATRAAAGVGQLLAVAGGLAGVFVLNSPWLMLIALFVYFGAGAELGAVETRAIGRGLTVEQMMVTQFNSIPIHATLQRATEMLLEGEQREFPVVDNLGRVEGILTRESLIKGLSHLGTGATVGQTMVTPVPIIPAGLGFEPAYQRLRDSGLPALPVADGAGKLIGLLTLDNIADLLLVRRAVQRR